MSEKPSLAPVATLYTHTLRDVPAILRSIADAVEAGEYGGTVQCAVVLNSAKLEIFSAGADPTEVHYLLCCGAARMQEPLLRKGRG